MKKAKLKGIAQEEEFSVCRSSTRIARINLVSNGMWQIVKFYGILFNFIAWISKWIAEIAVLSATINPYCLTMVLRDSMYEYHTPEEHERTQIGCTVSRYLGKFINFTRLKP